MRTWSLALAILISGVVFAPPVRALNLLDLEQKLAPNTDGNLESESEVFFNWGLFRSGFVYRSEDITKMAVVNGQDLAINIRTRSYDIIALRVKDGGIGDDDFFFAPFIGGCFINREEKRIGENLGTDHFWFTHKAGNTLFNIYGAADITLHSGDFGFSLSGGGGYLFKNSNDEYRTSKTDTTTSSDSTSQGFRGWGELRLMQDFFGNSLQAHLVGRYEQEGAYYKQIASDDTSSKYAYYVRQITLGFEVHLLFLATDKGATPRLGFYYINYSFEPLKKGIEGYSDERFRFEFGIKL